jgi:hypothetical protein
MLLATSCSEYKTLPQYVSVEKLNNLTPGMNKVSVANTLGAQPYDAFHGTESGCELYSYKYLHRKQEIDPNRKEDPGSLRGNTPVYEDVKDVYIFFENGELSSVMTQAAATNKDFVATLEQSCEGPVYGCTDQEALNYNEDAQVDDGSCEFCPCDYYKNPDYDAERQCGEQCLPYDNGSEEEESEEEECSLCDVVQNATGEVTLNINASSMTTGAGSSNSSVQSRNGSPTSARSILGNAANSGKKKDIEVPSIKRNAPDASDLSRSRNKKLENLKGQLAKSEERDAKRGKESRQTKLIKKAIEKIEARG